MDTLHAFCRLDLPTLRHYHFLKYARHDAAKRCNTIGCLSAIETLHRNRYLASTVASIRQAVVRGQSLTAPLSRTTAYMPMLAQMMAIAERTGKTTEILEQVTKFHEERLQATTKRLGALMEPILIVFIGGFVG